MLKLPTAVRKAWSNQRGNQKP